MEWTLLILLSLMSTRCSSPETDPGNVVPLGGDGSGGSSGSDHGGAHTGTTTSDPTGGAGGAGGATGGSTGGATGGSTGGAGGEAGATGGDSGSGAWEPCAEGATPCQPGLECMDVLVHDYSTMSLCIRPCERDEFFDPVPNSCGYPNFECMRLNYKTFGCVLKCELDVDCAPPMTCEFESQVLRCDYNG